jgi:hypothetical protein
MSQYIVLLHCEEFHNQRRWGGACSTHETGEECVEIFGLKIQRGKAKPRSSSTLVIRKCSVRISAGTPVILSGAFAGFLRRPWKCGILPRLGNDHFETISDSSFTLPLNVSLATVNHKNETVENAGVGTT